MMFPFLRFTRPCSSHWEVLLQTSRVRAAKKSVCIRDKRFLVFSMEAQNTRGRYEEEVEGVSICKTRSEKNEMLKSDVKEGGSIVSVRSCQKDAREKEKPDGSNALLKEQTKMFMLGASEETGQSVLIGSSSGEENGKSKKKVETVSSSGEENGKSKKEVETVEVEKNVDSLESEKTTQVKIKESSNIDSSSEDDGEHLNTVPFVPFEGTNGQSEFVFKRRIKTARGGHFYNLETEISNHTFPSVTTILENTMEKKKASLLLGWNLKQIKMHGYTKHNNNIKKVLKTGSNFHKEVENRLLELMSEHEKLLLPERLPSTMREKKKVESASKQKKSEKQVYSKTSTNPSKSSTESSTKASGKASSSESIPTCLKDGNSDKSGFVTPNVLIPNDEHSSFPDEWLTPMPDTYANDDMSNGDVFSLFHFEAEPIVSSDDLFVNRTAKNNGFQGAGGERTDLLTERSDKLEHMETSGAVEMMEETLEVDDVDALLMQSIEHVLINISDITALETPVVHLELGYAGTLDCVAKYKGVTCVIDWKTSRKPKPTLKDCYDYPLQLVAYAGAVNQNPKAFSCKLQNVLIVVVYADGSPADAHFLNIDLCQKFWLEWLKRLYSYQTRFSCDLSEIVC